MLRKADLSFPRVERNMFSIVSTMMYLCDAAFQSSARDTTAFSARIFLREIVP